IIGTNAKYPELFHGHSTRSASKVSPYANSPPKGIPKTEYTCSTVIFLIVKSSKLAFYRLSLL
ncbi:hypothetical protein ACFL3G_10280, partial [Planctomycetota bacterium]